MKLLADAWHGFWFRPRPTSTVAVLRIGYGLLMVGWAASIGPDLRTFFGRSGVLPVHPSSLWGVLRFANSDAALIALWIVFLAAGVCLTIGYRTRLAAVVVVVGFVSFQHRNPHLVNGGDTLIRLIGLYLMLAPSGVSLSLDRWRRHREVFWSFPARAPWALRLVQLQICLMYAFSVFFKLGGETWRNGTAMGYALRVGQIERLRVPEGIIDSLFLIRPLTWLALATEASLAVLVWNRRLRPWVLAAGVALHLAIEVTMSIGFFSLIVLVAYLAFIPEDTLSEWLLKRRRLVRRWSSGRGTQRVALPDSLVGGEFPPPREIGSKTH